MDVDRLLNIEKRTGIKDADIDKFVDKASAVEAAIKGMIDGTVDPNTIKIKGIKSDEELAEEIRLKEIEDKRIAEKKEILRLQRKIEEKERWWAGAELFRSKGAEIADAEIAAVENENDYNISHTNSSNNNKDNAKETTMRREMERLNLDYSKWDTWNPTEDPASIEERELEEKAAEKRKNAQFEKDNTEFCNQFMDDMKERQKKTDKKAESANVMRIKGNNEFKRKDYRTALIHYMDSLKVLPYESKTLTNIAQVFIKQEEYDDAEEFLKRVLYLDPKNVKGLSRMATVLCAVNRFKEALSMCERALRWDESNNDVIKQHGEVAAIVEEIIQTERVRQRALESTNDTNSIFNIARYSSNAQTNDKIQGQSKAEEKSVAFDSNKQKQELQILEEQLKKLTTLKDDELNEEFEGILGSVPFQTFNSVMNSFIEGRLTISRGEIVAQNKSSKSTKNTGKDEDDILFNVFDALSDLCIDPDIRIYMRTSGALLVVSSCLLEMTGKLLPELAANINVPSWEEAVRTYRQSTGSLNSAATAAMKANSSDNISVNPATITSNMALLDAGYACLAVICQDNRGSKLLLSDQGCTSIAKNILRISAQGGLQKDGLGGLFSSAHGVAKALRGVSAFLLENGLGAKACPSVSASITQDSNVLADAARVIGELSTQTFTVNSQVGNTNTMKMAPEALAVALPLTELVGLIAANPGQNIITSKKAKSKSPEASILLGGPGALAICALGSLLHKASLRVASSLKNTNVDSESIHIALSELSKELGLVHTALDTLAHCSRNDELIQLFSLPLPDLDEDAELGTLTVAQSVLSLTQRLALYLSAIQNKDIDNKDANATYKVVKYVGAQLRPLLDVSLSVLSNVGRDKEIGAQSVRGQLVSMGVVELCLEANSALLHLMEKDVMDNIGTGDASQFKSITSGIENGWSLTARLFSSLLARVAPLQEVGQTLGKIDTYKLLQSLTIRAISERYDKRGSKGLGGIGDGGSMDREYLDKHVGNLVTSLAYAKPTSEAFATLKETNLAAMILRIFPIPRMDLNEVTPLSVTKAPAESPPALSLGNAAIILRSISDNPEGKDIFASLFDESKSKALLAVERLICAIATCTNTSVRKNVAIVLARAAALPGIRTKLEYLNGMKILRELSAKGEI